MLIFFVWEALPPAPINIRNSLLRNPAESQVAPEKSDVPSLVSCFFQVSFCSYQ